MSSRGSTTFLALATVTVTVLLANSTGSSVLDQPADPITDDIAGLAALVGIVLATLFLIRRAPR